MDIGSQTRMLTHQAFDQLPIHWQVLVKRWLKRHLRLTEQPGLAGIEAFVSKHRSIANHRSDNAQVLFWRGIPGRGSIYGEAIIALALRLRGIDARFVICDGTLSGCIQRSLEDNKPINKWRERCPQCIDYGVRVLDAFSIPYVGIGKLVSDERRIEFRRVCNDLSNIELASFEYHEIPVGAFARSSTMRYLKGKPLDGYEGILREYLFSALVCTEAAIGAVKRLKPNRIFMQRHIEYVGWAPAYVVLTKAGLPTTLWTGSIALDGQITLRNVVGTDWSSIYNLSDEAWKRRSSQPLTKEQEQALDATLSNPWRTRQQTTHSVSNAEHSGIAHIPRERLLQELDISDVRPIWCVFAHVTWDAGVNAEVVGFADVFDWSIATAQTMLETDDATWLLKVHPAESSGGSLGRGVEDLIKDRFPGASQHIRFISADSEITTNDLCSILAGGVTMQGTVGVQLPARGIPVIVAVPTHYTGKGFTYDGFTRERYLELVHQAADIPLVSEYQHKLARRYAYAIYFQCNIPINMARGRSGYAPLDPNKLDLLLPGNDAVMDMICERIIGGGEFIL